MRILYAIADDNKGSLAFFVGIFYNFIYCRIISFGSDSDNSLMSTALSHRIKSGPIAFGNWNAALGCYTNKLIYRSLFIRRGYVKLLYISAALQKFLASYDPADDMNAWFEKVKAIAPTLSILGIAVTKADERKNYFHQTLDTLGELDNVYLFKNVIRIDSAVEWSQDNSKPVLAYKRASRSAKEYFELAKEILEQCQ